MLQFICSQYHMDYIVQPLPVDNMALKMVGENEIELTWQPVAEPTGANGQMLKNTLFILASEMAISTMACW